MDQFMNIEVFPQTFTPHFYRRLRKATISMRGLENFTKVDACSEAVQVENCFIQALL